jgi:hypothetical protein
MEIWFDLKIIFVSCVSVLIYCNGRGSFPLFRHLLALDLGDRLECLLDSCGVGML